MLLILKFSQRIVVTNIKFEFVDDEYYVRIFKLLWILKLKTSRDEGFKI